MKIYPHRAVRESRVRGDFGAGQAFHQTEHERFAIGFGQRANGFEYGQGFAAVVSVGGSSFLLSRVQVFFKRDVRLRLTVEIGGAIASDRGDPAAEMRGVSQGAEPGKG